MFLNAAESESYLELDECFSDFKDNIERDKDTLIIWSILDGDLLEEERSRLLLGWCGQFYKDTKPYFEAFASSAERDYSSQTRVASNAYFTPSPDLQVTPENSEPRKGIATAEMTGSTLDRDSGNLNSSQRDSSDRKLKQPRGDSFLGATGTLQPPKHVPPVLVPNTEQKEQIDMIVLHVARLLKGKVLDLIPRLCEELSYSETFQTFEYTRMSNQLARLAKDPRDVEFLGKFAFTQIFSLSVDKHIDSLQQRENH